MPELRKDFITGEWVIIAPERAQRPNEFVPAGSRNPGTSCPFCEGNETQTPPEILALRKKDSKPDGPGWSLRVVSNKFPAVQPKAEPAPWREAIPGRGLFARRKAVGAHEVIIESPDHRKSPAELSMAEIEDVLWAFRERILKHKKDKRIKYILIFKNHGPAAGASLEHNHSQLVALTMLPARIRRKLGQSQRYFLRHERCVFCEIIRKEREAAARVISEGKAFIAFTAYAARFPYETRVFPKEHQARFEGLSRTDQSELARMLKSLFRSLEAALNNPSYNLVLHTAPPGAKCDTFYHWRLEVIPRIAGVAGFEWGAGMHMNTASPERAAERLREIFVKSGG